MKRFTETLKWDDPWFRKLPMASKLFWQWILDHCDHAGVIDPDIELAEFQIGAKGNGKGKLNLLESLGDRVVLLPNGKVWIVKFMEFQYPKLSRKCPAHTPVFKSIEKNGLDTLALDYPKGIPTLKEEDKVKDEEEAKRKSKARASSQEEAEAYAETLGLEKTDGSAFFDSREGNGWKIGGSPIKDWKATMRSWKTAGHHPSQKQAAATQPRTTNAESNGY